MRADLVPTREHTTVTNKCTAVLHYHIKNVATLEEITDSSHFPANLSYKVTFDPKHWTFQDNSRGMVEGPKLGQLSKLSFRVVPQLAGSLPLPTLILRFNPKENEESSGKKGSKVMEEVSFGYIPLTSAQVYDLTQGEVVNVQPLQLSS